MNKDLVCGLFDNLIVMCQKPGIQRSVIGNRFKATEIRFTFNTGIYDLMH
jgi:hypothetical protein